jgi:hypothetical protein
MLKVARSALHISLFLWERVGVRETIMAHATYVFWADAGAMIVRKGKQVLRIILSFCHSPSPLGTNQR